MSAADGVFLGGCFVTFVAAMVGLVVLGVWARFSLADLRASARAFHAAGRARVAAYAGGPLRPTHRHTRSTR